MILRGIKVKQEYSTLKQIIRDRRAVKKGYLNKEVTEEVVKELLEDAIWAPTHGNRQPWRFIFVGQDQLPAFAKKVAQTYSADLQQNRENYLNEPNAILVVTMEAPEMEKQWDENFGATACMLQNFWLLAWEKKLGVVWKTNPHIYDPKVKEILHIPDNEKIIGFIHLGYFEEQPAKKDRISVVEKFTTFKA
ncbi:nitroreductase family protein [Virgibacillus sp. W0430]|uniref:nitroreductase family protein n=1 Tax=Virgibacillus sp. W0430 TaxID=3391580 RepID=UPI003F47CAB1